jgi:hypothetical protein
MLTVSNSGTSQKGPLLPAGEESLASKSHALTGNRQPPASALRLLPPGRAIGNQTLREGGGPAALEGAAVDRGGRSMMCAMSWVMLSRARPRKPSSCPAFSSGSSDSKDTGPEKGGRISVK